MAVSRTTRMIAMGPAPEPNGSAGTFRELLVRCGRQPDTVHRPQGASDKLSYDALNRMTQVTYADGSIATYTYDAGNRLTRRILSPGRSRSP